MRILTRRIFTEKDGRKGLKPTRALMDAVCKYKDFWKPGAQNHFLYVDQSECTKFIHDGLAITSNRASNAKSWIGPTMLRIPDTPISMMELRRA